jgi:hypothetical protein
MTATVDTVFLFDVDNTLLDNDRVQADLGVHLAKYYGEATCERFWEFFERLRSELGYSDYLGRWNSTGWRRCASARSPVSSASFMI